MGFSSGKAAYRETGGKLSGNDFILPVIVWLPSFSFGRKWSVIELERRAWRWQGTSWCSLFAPVWCAVFFRNLILFSHQPLEVERASLALAECGSPGFNECGFYCRLSERKMVKDAVSCSGSLIHRRIGTMDTVWPGAPGWQAEGNSSGILASTDCRSVVFMMRIHPYVLQGLTLNSINNISHSECCEVFQNTANVVVMGKKPTWFESVTDCILVSCHSVFLIMVWLLSSEGCCS